jgi:hypothetical protein
MTSETLIENQISLLGPEYRAFVESPFIEEMAVTFGEQLTFSPRQVDIFENALFLFLTLIFTAEETKDFIVRNCDLPPSEAELVWSAIESSLPEGMLALISEARYALQTDAPLTTSSAQPVATLENEIAEAEHEFASMQGIRTMATDMRMRPAAPSAETTYRSSQADILPTPTPAPRWESE